MITTKQLLLAIALVASAACSKKDQKQADQAVEQAQKAVDQAEQAKATADKTIDQANVVVDQAGNAVKNAEEAAGEAQANAAKGELQGGVAVVQAKASTDDAKELGRQIVAHADELAKLTDQIMDAKSDADLDAVKARMKVLEDEQTALRKRLDALEKTGKK